MWIELAWMSTKEITINPNSVARFLAIAASMIVLASIAGQVAAYLTGHEQVYRYATLSYVDEERNIPTAFSVFLLLSGAVLFALTSALEGKPAGTRVSRWTVLAAGFMVMAVDEAWTFHERLMRPMRSLLGDDRPEILFYAWVVPGIALVLALTPFFVGFLRRLPSRVRIMFLAAAILYLGGAIGFELVAGRFNEVHGLYGWQGPPGVLHLQYSFIATAEESLEMAGSIVVIRALLLYLAERHREVRFLLALLPVAISDAAAASRNLHESS